MTATILRGRLFFAIVCVACLLTLAHGQAPRTAPVTIQGDHFVRDGKPYQIIAGAIHYPRVPREYWRDRLQKAHAMGLNTIETYVFWNLHEPTPGDFNFNGQLDVASFIHMAQEEGLNVILRPGPYICAEWEAGGLPAWLFAGPRLNVRTPAPRFLPPAHGYLTPPGKDGADLQSTQRRPHLPHQ